MIKLLAVFLAALVGTLYLSDSLTLSISRPITLDSLGACQGVSYLGGKAYLYGDREIGLIREYTLGGDSLLYTGREYKLTVGGQDVINHPTGIAHNGAGPTFIGNSIRLNPEGTKWRAVLYSVDWNGLRRTGTLDGNLKATIEDDTCIQGTRPEYVKYENKWYVATADYGNRANEVRLYDPERLARAKNTSEKGVLVKKFTCSAWVQNLHWIPEKNVLVLIQNQIEGRKWRFTFLDFRRSVETGKEVVLKTVDIADRPDELEGFTLLGNLSRGVAVSSSRRMNANLMQLTW